MQWHLVQDFRISVLIQLVNRYFPVSDFRGSNIQGVGRSPDIVNVVSNMIDPPKLETTKWKDIQRKLCINFYFLAKIMHGLRLLGTLYTGKLWMDFSIKKQGDYVALDFMEHFLFKSIHNIIPLILRFRVEKMRKSEGWSVQIARI